MNTQTIVKIFPQANITEAGGLVDVFIPLIGNRKIQNLAVEFNPYMEEIVLKELDHRGEEKSSKSFEDEKEFFEALKYYA